jgi:hypothetical protein
MQQNIFSTEERYRRRNSNKRKNRKKRKWRGGKMGEVEKKKARIGLQSFPFSRTRPNSPPNLG